ncbi:MAG: DNA/RNA helicase domain-containing protein [Thermoplasmata archaeon]
MNNLYCNTIKNFVSEYEKGNMVVNLANEYKTILGREPDPKLKNSWDGELKFLYTLSKELLSKEKSSENIGIVLEYIIPGGFERVDSIFIGGNPDTLSIAILELKGWKNIVINNIDDYFVKSNEERVINPIYQVLNYEGKIKFSVKNINNESNIKSFVILYNISGNSKFDKIYFKDDRNKLVDKLITLLLPSINTASIQHFLNSSYVQNQNLFEAVRKYYNDIMDGAIASLAANGYGFYSDQLEPYADIIDDLKYNRKNVYLISGGPGSGKTLIALNLLLRALSMNKKAVLAYRNNRMIESLRFLLNSIKIGLGSTLIKYYSTGNKNRPGIAEDYKDHFDIAIFDEAQRMTSNNIINGEKVADISVFFYDETQILGKNEEGFDSNFKTLLNNPRVIILKGLYRNGYEYNRFVNDLLSNKVNNNKYSYFYDLKVFNSIIDMVNSLKIKSQNKKKVALLASFTEAKGSTQSNSLDNIRVGYPLPSSFDLYKNSNITIKWLMDPKMDYAPFWVNGGSNKMESCASVYGAQGFETDYAGLIWGRDLVYRKNSWALGENCEDFEIKVLFNDAKKGNTVSEKKVKELLINRYRILLTRGVYGTYIFFEDSETKKFFENLINL